MSFSADIFFRYLPTSDRDRQWGLYVVGAGRQQVAAGQHYPPKGHPASHEFAWEKGRVLQEFQVVYIAEGRGEFESRNTGLLPVLPGTAIFVFPNVWHRYRPLANTGWKEYWVAFAGEDAERMVDRGFIWPDKPVVYAGVSETVLHSFNALIDRVHGEPVGFQQLIATDASAIVAGILAGEWSSQVSSHSIELVRKIKIELEKHADVAPRMESIAAQLDISPSHLHHLFKKHTGLSPYQYHMQMRMYRARQLLRGDLSVKEVAKTLSFQSVFHFSKAFKKSTGVSPRQWRNAGEEKYTEPQFSHEG